MFVQQDRSDILFYNDYLEESEKLQAIVQDGEKRHWAFQDIATDLFCLMYEPEPKDSEGQLPLGLKIAKQNIEKIKELREFADLKRMTQLDPMLSGIGTEALAKQFIKLLPAVSEDPEQLLAKKQVADELGYTQASQELQAKIDTANAYMVKADKLVMDDEGSRQLMRAALQSAVQETQEAMDGMSSFGQDESAGTMKQVSLKEKMELAKRLRESKKLKEIAKLAGRFIRIARKKNKELMVSNSINSIETGDCLARTLPSELSKLGSPLLSGLFYKSLAEKNLLQYKLKSKVSNGVGPILICLDSSGSMQGAREIESKAIALALLEIARIEKRDFIVSQFGNEDQYSELIAIKGKVDTLTLLSFLEAFLNGGTSFQRPLTEAMKHISSSKWSKADLIFLSDGQAKLTPAFLDEYMRIKKEKQFSCIGILLGKDAGGLQVFSDELFSVDDLLSDEENNAKLQDKMFKV